jgi:hypothetical protein
LQYSGEPKAESTAETVEATNAVPPINEAALIQ